MPFSKEKIEAYEVLENAIAQLRKAYDIDNSMLTGWVLLTSALEPIAEEDKDPESDELDLQTTSGWFSRRAQDPTLSYGIIQESIRHYNRMQHQCGDDS